MEDKKPAKRDFVRLNSQLYPETLSIKQSGIQNDWTLELEYTSDVPLVLSLHFLAKVQTDMLYNVTEK